MEPLEPIDGVDPYVGCEPAIALIKEAYGSEERFAQQIREYGESPAEIQKQMLAMHGHYEGSAKQLDKYEYWLSQSKALESPAFLRYLAGIMGAL
jgi:hypothetical protein